MGEEWLNELQRARHSPPSRRRRSCPRRPRRPRRHLLVTPSHPLTFPPSPSSTTRRHSRPRDPRLLLHLVSTSPEPLPHPYRDLFHKVQFFQFLL
ncbi:hypothetical protein QVD17_17238 [Tagetes erecta]|uniref:Uncharacterized protein n=1 Tax=Tagetes erecta TaxID=13708 RepID=A0AAD8KRX3_TARER|nr:hypothetical protein QVD17_17238 [Tagetes erecta]